MTAGLPYRHNSVEAFSEDRIRCLQEACTSHEVATLFERRGMSRVELHEFFNFASVLVEALGDAMEEVWKDYANVGRCPDCDQRRWSTLPDSSLSEDESPDTRECNVCGRRWMPMKFHREEMVSGRIRSYLDQPANYVEETP